jgi:hypothetical protein
MTKNLIAITLAAASLATVPTAQASTLTLDKTLATPGEAQLIPVATGGCYRGERAADCRQRLQVERHSHRHYVYRNGRYEDTSGAAVASAIFGFVLGAAIAGSQQDHDYYYSHRNDRGWRTRCQGAYPNFDYRTGTYNGNDGYRHYCTR